MGPICWIKNYEKNTETSKQIIRSIHEIKSIAICIFFKLSYIKHGRSKVRVMAENPVFMGSVFCKLWTYCWIKNFQKITEASSYTPRIIHQIKSLAICSMGEILNVKHRRAPTTSVGRRRKIKVHD